MKGKSKDKGDSPCFTKMNNGACDKPDCPWSHDDELIEASKVWYDVQYALEAKKAAEDGTVPGKGAFVVIRTAIENSENQHE